MDEDQQQDDSCHGRLQNGQSDGINMNNGADSNHAPMDSSMDINNNNTSNNNNNETSQQQQQQQQQQHQEQVRPIPSTQEVHTREKLFDFIALLQGRRMDDQRAILKPSTSTTS